MPETATKAPPLVTDYIDNPDFVALPYRMKLQTLQKALDTDHEVTRLDDAGQEELINYILSQGIHGDDTTGVNLTPEERAQVSYEQPANQTTPQEPPGFLSNLATTVGKGIVKGLDYTPEMITKPIGVLTEQYGKIPERLGLVEPGTGNVFTRAGQGLQTPAATRPLETTIAGKEGFKPSPPGYAALEHVLSAAVGTIIPGAVTARLFPLLVAGRAVPAIDQVKKAAALAAQGAASAEVVKVAGGGEMAQFITELAGGLLTPTETFKVFEALAKRPGLQKYLMRTHEKQVTDIATEAFAGPKLGETVRGGTTTRTSQDLVLDDFLEGEKRPVKRAQDIRTKAEGDLTAVQAQGRALQSDAVQRIRTAEDLARDQASIAQQKLYDIEDEIIKLRTQTGTDTRAQEATLAQRKLDVQEEYRQSVRASQDIERGVQEEVRVANKQAQQQVADLQDHLDRITVANQRDISDALDFGKRNVESIAPDMAAAGVQSGAVGRKAVRTQGKTEIEFYDTVQERLRKNAELGYGTLEREFGIQVPVTGLYKIVQKYKDSLTDVSVPTAQIDRSYAPTSVISDFEARLAQLAEKQPGVGGKLDNVIIGLVDIQNLRSRLLDDYRHTPATSQKMPLLRQFLGEVDAFVDATAKQYPEAIAAYRELSSAYRREKIRLTGDPGYQTQVRNPFTGELLRTPDEIARITFGSGPGVSKGTVGGAQRERLFGTYLRDLDDVLQDAYLQGDMATQAVATNSKNALFDSVRAQFYDAAMGTGEYLPKKAAQWIKENDALLTQSPELKKLFRTPRDRANAIREVEAAAQGAQALPNAYIQAMRDSLRETQATGGERVFEARGVAQGERRAAEDVRGTAQRDIATESADIAESNANLRTQTAGDLTQAARERKAELARIRQEKQNATRSIEDDRALQVERERLATEDLKLAQDTEAKAVAYYKETFGARDAAERALVESTAERTLGATPADIIAQMERLPGPESGNDKAYYFSKFFEKAKGNKAIEDALLQARWRAFLGENGVADSVKAAKFIKDNKPWLQRYYPDYLTNIERVQNAFEAINKVYVERPTNIMERSLFSHAGPPGITTAALFTLGHMDFRSAAAGGVAVAALLELNFRRKIAALNRVYLNPSDAAILARAVGPAVTQEQARQAAWSILSRTGVLGKEQVENAVK